MKILFVDYDNPGEFQVFSSESEAEKDSDVLASCHNETGDLFRFSERGGGLYERAEIDCVDKDDDGNSIDEEYSIAKWTPIA